MSTAPKVKPAKAAGTQNTSERDWESNTPADFRVPVGAALENFLAAADQLRRWRLQVAIRAFRTNRLAPAAGLLKPCLDGWIELLVGGDLPIGLRTVPQVELAIDYFRTMLAIANQNPEIVGKPVPWAESQTRSALNQVFGTKWFSKPTPENKAESHKVNSWLREIDETVFVPRPRPDFALLKDNKAVAQQWLTWHGHGWLATWLPPSTPALSLYGDTPFEPLLQEVQDYVVEDITSYLFHGVEDRLKRTVNMAQIEHACSKPSAQPPASGQSTLSKHKVSLRYRSSLKQAVMARLIQEPKATTLQLINWVDGTNAAELPTLWRNGGDRTFASAYRDPKLRRKIATFVSKVRKDLRDSNLPQ